MIRIIQKVTFRHQIEKIDLTTQYLIIWTKKLIFIFRGNKLIRKISLNFQLQSIRSNISSDSQYVVFSQTKKRVSIIGYVNLKIGELFYCSRIQGLVMNQLFDSVSERLILQIIKEGNSLSLCILTLKFVMKSYSIIHLTFQPGEQDLNMLYKGFHRISRNYLFRNFKALRFETNQSFLNKVSQQNVFYNLRRNERTRQVTQRIALNQKLLRAIPLTNYLDPQQDAKYLQSNTFLYSSQINPYWMYILSLCPLTNQHSLLLINYYTGQQIWSEYISNCISISIQQNFQYQKKGLKKRQTKKDVNYDRCATYQEGAFSYCDLVTKRNSHFWNLSEIMEMKFQSNLKESSQISNGQIKN